MRTLSLLAAVGLALAVQVSPAAEPTATPDLRIVPVERQQADLTVSIAATITPFRTVQLTAQTPGRVKRIAGREGDTFVRGAVLIELDDAALLARRESAFAARESALAAIQSAQAQYQQELYSPRSDAVRTAPGGFGFPAMMDQMFGVPMQDALGLREQGVQRYTDMIDVQTRLAQARTQLRQADASIREIEAQLRDTRSVAPFDGVIDKVHVEEGDTVQPGQPLVDYSQAGLFKVEADLPVHLARHLVPDQALPVRLDNGSEPVSARVHRIHPSADPRRHTIHVELALPPGTHATAGQYAEVLVTDHGAGVAAQLAIPASAVIHKGGMPLVFSVDEHGIAHLRVVRLGEELAQGRIAVLSGLHEGDRVIDQPPAGLKAGRQVLVPEAAPAEPAARATPNTANKG